MPPDALPPAIVVVAVLCPNMDWLRLSKLFKDKSVSLLTKCDVVCPTTPLENSGGISIDNEDPKLDDESRLALFDPASASSPSSLSSSSSSEVSSSSSMSSSSLFEVINGLLP